LPPRSKLLQIVISANSVLAAETQVQLSQCLIEIVSHSSPLSQGAALSFFQLLFSDSSHPGQLGCWDFVYGNDMVVLFDVLSRLIFEFDSHVGSAQSLLAPLVSCLDAYLNWPDVAKSISAQRLSEVCTILSQVVTANDPCVSLGELSISLATAFSTFSQTQSKRQLSPNFEALWVAKKRVCVELNFAAQSCINKIAAVLKRSSSNSKLSTVSPSLPDSVAWKSLPFKPAESFPHASQDKPTTIIKWTLERLEPFFNREELQPLEMPSAHYLLLSASKLLNVESTSHDGFVDHIAAVLLFCSGHGLGHGLGVGLLHPLTHLIDLPRLSVFTVIDAAGYHLWFLFFSVALLTRLAKIFESQRLNVGKMDVPCNLMSSQMNHVTLLLICLDRLLASSSARISSHLLPQASMKILYSYLLDLVSFIGPPHTDSSASESDIEFELQCHELLTNTVLRLTLNMGLVLFSFSTEPIMSVEAPSVHVSDETVPSGTRCPFITLFHRFYAFSNSRGGVLLLRLKAAFLTALKNISQPPRLSTDSALDPIDSYQTHSHIYVYIADSLSFLLSRSNGDIDQFYCEVLSVLLHHVQISSGAQRSIIAGLSIHLQVKHANGGSLLRNERSPFASLLFLCLSNGSNRSSDNLDGFVPNVHVQVVCS
jgi:hypothetical protein